MFIFIFNMLWDNGENKNQNFPIYFNFVMEKNLHDLNIVLFASGRREELTGPPLGIVKNLRGLFENPQGFEARKG